jgi:hypothetical protein
MEKIMRKLLVLAAAAAMAFGIAASANAAVVKWSGSSTIELGTLPSITTTGTGIATVNASGGGSHLNTLSVNGGITGGGTVVVTDPEVTVGGIVSVRIENAELQAGVLGPFSGSTTGNAGPLTQNTLAIHGTARICLLSTTCVANIAIALQGSGPNGPATVGVGGLLTAGGETDAIRISILNHPWTVGTVTLAGIPTDNGGTTAYSAAGFVHGPASNGASSAVLTSAVIQVITPQEVDTIGVPGDNSKLAVFSVLNFHVIPEPGLLLLLGSGVVGLAVIGRSRMRK